MVNLEKFVLHEEEVIFNVSRLRVISVEFFLSIFYSLYLSTPRHCLMTILRLSVLVCFFSSARMCGALHSLSAEHKAYKETTL